MSHPIPKEVEEKVRTLYVEHLEDLLIKADMAVKYKVKDEEEHFEEMRKASREFLDALRQALLSVYNSGRSDTSFNKVVSFLDSREKVIKEQNYPKAMAYDDLKSTIQRLKAVSAPSSEDNA